MIRDFLELVIRPTLRHMREADERLWTTEAEKLLMGTVLAESALQEIRQQPSGPALSFYQIEPTTRQDIDRYLDRLDKTLICAVVNEMRAAWPLNPDEQIVTNMALATAYARIKYWMSPLPIPDDIEGMANYWLRVYNAGGRGTVTGFVRPFREFVQPLYG